MAGPPHPIHLPGCTSPTIADAHALPERLPGSFGYTLPDEIVTSEELEQRLEPLYRRLRLPEGRLELMTGIRQRRFWPPGTAAQREERRERPSKAIRARGHRPQPYRGAGPRLGVPRLPRAGHRLPRAPPAGAAAAVHDLRRLERLPRAAERHACRWPT